MGCGLSVPVLIFIDKSGRYSALHGSRIADSGVDLFCDESVTIDPGEVALVRLGIHARDTQGSGLLLMPRSSISKTPLSLANGVGLIDPGFTGEIRAAFQNHSESPFAVGVGERLVQLVHPSCIPPQIRVVKSFPSTHRASGSFGSTGRH